jgi:leucine-rich repeat protein SHOC2
LQFSLQLVLTGNRLTSLPRNLGQLSGLLSLEVSENSIRGIVDGSLAGLTALRELGLACNPLESCPQDLGKLTNLQVLDLRKTLLPSLPAGSFFFFPAFVHFAL